MRVYDLKITPPAAAAGGIASLKKKGISSIGGKGDKVRDLVRTRETLCRRHVFHLARNFQNTAVYAHI